MLTCSILTSEHEVTALADEWHSLHAEVGESPFSDYNWFHIWWRTTGKANDCILHVVIGRKNEKLVAVLPLRVLHKKGFRILQHIGTEAFYQCDMLCEDSTYADELWKTARASKLYDFAHLRDVRPNSICEKSLSVFARLHEKNRAPYLKIEWATPEQWLKSTPKEQNLQRHTLQRRLRRLKEKGEVAYEVYRKLPLPEGMIEGLVEQKSAWCRKNGMTGMFDQPNILSFFRQFITHAAENGTLLFARLKCGDAIIAYHLMLIDGKRVCNYVPSADYAWSRYSPGHLSTLNAIAWAIQNGFEEFDQMHGDFAYKYQFSNGVRECHEYTFSNSVYGQLGAHLFVKRRRFKIFISEKLRKIRKKQS